MNLNKSVISLLLLSCILAAGHADANSTDIHFSGIVRAGSCVVDTASQNIEVRLGNILKSAFTAPGSQSPARAFAIRLKNCKAVSIAAVKMEGTPDAADNRYFAIQNIPNAAGGVAVKVWQKNSGILQVPNGAAVDHPVASGATSVELEYYAAYVQTAGSVTSGLANSYADFTIEYR